MDFIQANAKAIAGAVTTLVVLLLRPYLPAVADPTFQPALEIVLSFLIVALAVWLVPNKPKPTTTTVTNGMGDSKPAPPLTGLLLAAVLLPALLGACATQPVSSPEAFSRSCAGVGEAMLQVNQLRRQGQVDDATFVRIDDLYDAAVRACDTLPVGETATAIAAEKVSAFLAAAGGVTGGTYGY